MDVEQAMNVAAQSKIEGLHGLYPKAAQVLADEVSRRHGIGGELVAARVERDEAQRELAAYKQALSERTCLGWIEDTQEDVFNARVAALLAANA